MKNMTFYGKSLLFLGAHPDDIELGCGALLADLAGQADVFCMTFSDNKKNPDLQNLESEHYNSMHVLGLKDHQIGLVAMKPDVSLTFDRKCSRIVGTS
jgi:LmbE family N-acetylglucosaminyl deacetylase